MHTMTDLYTRFTSYLRHALGTSAMDSFKSHPDVMDMLEHVNPSLGEEYMTHLQSTCLSMDLIRAYCQKNDRIGGGQKHPYPILTSPPKGVTTSPTTMREGKNSPNLTTSPSNLRYLFQAHLICSHLRHLQKETVEIVEVGCGYGGLFLAMDMVAPLYSIRISRYHLIDLPESSALQQWYLSTHDCNTPTHFHPASTYGDAIDNTDLFLISNYCFSEIAEEHQQRYRRQLFPRVSHGFMAWNNIPTYDFGFPMKEDVEYPLTGPMNRYVYF
jgi:hypothetical protein